MPRRSDAKNKMIKTALLLFREKGYHGVGLAEILEQSGAPKGSFYHHFPGGKQELALAVLDAANRFMLRLIDNAFENAGTVEAAVDAVIDAIKGSLKGGDDVRLVGFGTFSVAQRAATTGRNPRTGEPIKIPASKQPKFKAGKELKEAVNK